MHSYILLNLHVTPPFLSKVGCSTFYGAAKSLNMEEQVYWYLELVLDVVSFCVYKAEVMYKFK